MSVLKFCFIGCIFFFFFKQKTAYEMLRSLVGSEMCIRDRRPPPPTNPHKIPSKFTVDPAATLDQTLTAAFGDTTRSFGPHVSPLCCAPAHFTITKPLQGTRIPGTSHYVPSRATSEAPHLPSTPGIRRNLTTTNTQAEENGNAAIRSGNFRQAVRYYSQALADDPRNPNLFRNRAAAYAQLANFQAALKDADKVCQLMPHNRKALIRRKAVEDYMQSFAQCTPCLLYTSDAADEEDSVDLGGRRIIKKKKNIECNQNSKKQV
eukprot:TRINITY_DN6077_c0_g1_i1.p1 TRINITY_DN6077_c0_g1~~TRINITY_DN6077_c0_g1_i1.p1  ORF type:complete len:263 (-),score=89.02 TRINITY_DN6077_c0_g1_i1:26-814(-)